MIPYTSLLQPKKSASAFACANIALIKYWGKRNQQLNLPYTNSLSKSLSIGTKTQLSFSSQEEVVLNGKALSSDDPFSKRLSKFIDLFRPDPTCFFRIDTENQIPTAAGLASSASGFAALVLAFNELLNWNLDRKNLSILARLGSGSACRSLYDGFVEWHAGTRDDGLDSFAEPLPVHFPELRLGLWIISSTKKPIDSRKAMQDTVATSSLYSSWPAKVSHDIITVKRALSDRDFAALGAVCENNSLTMHATMIAAQPSILYWLPETVEAMQQVWKWREQGLSLYFTMDAGPNLKLLFLEKDQEAIQQLLPQLQVC